MTFDIAVLRAMAEEQEAEERAQAQHTLIQAYDFCKEMDKDPESDVEYRTSIQFLRDRESDEARAKRVDHILEGMQSNDPEFEIDIGTYHRTAKALGRLK